MRQEPHPNYPNHPLFRITPLLDRGFQTVRFDPYEQVLVARIREGRYTRALFDCNSLYLDYTDRLDGRFDGQRRLAIKSRYTMTEAERKTWANSYGDPEAIAERQRLRKERAEAQAERQRAEQEWRERTALREAQKTERERQWREEDEKEQVERGKAPIVRFVQDDIAKIKAKTWRCNRCGGIETDVAPKGAGYILKCQACGLTGFGDRATFLKMVAA